MKMKLYLKSICWYNTAWHNRKYSVSILIKSINITFMIFCDDFFSWFWLFTFYHVYQECFYDDTNYTKSLSIEIWLWKITFLFKFWHYNIIGPKPPIYLIGLISRVKQQKLDSLYKKITKLKLYNGLTVLWLAFYLRQRLAMTLWLIYKPCMSKIHVGKNFRRVGGRRREVVASP